MYHISDDKRALRSADALYKGLLQCLKTTQFENVTVMDVVQHSDASRPTFYRLFDNTLDILCWKAEQILIKALNLVQKEQNDSFKNVFISFISAWIENEELLRALINHSLTQLLTQIHISHVGEIKALLLSGKSLSDKQSEYLSYMLSAMLPAVFQIWVKYPEADAETVFSEMQESLAIMQELFSN